MMLSSVINISGISRRNVLSATISVDAGSVFKPTKLPYDYVIMEACFATLASNGELRIPPVVFHFQVQQSSGFILWSRAVAGGSRTRKKG